MKLGLSTYSVHRLLQSGEWTVLDAIDWTAENGGEHVEIVPIGFTVRGYPELADAIRERAARRGLEVSNYAIGAQFLQPDEAALEREIERVMAEVEVANSLGAKLMRHDVASLPPPEATIARFDEAFPLLVQACALVADHAAQFGITTSVENHGYFIQASDRVHRLVDAVNRPNFRTTLDVGNFWCVDEEPAAAVRKNTAIASMVHLKDFYRRRPGPTVEKGFFSTAGGYRLRGAILGHGDLDLAAVVRELKTGGYDGYLSVEFEGMEPEREGAGIGLKNARLAWDEV